MSMETTVNSEWNGDKVIIQGKKVTKRSAFEIGLVVMGQAKLLAPVNWGYLAASITVQSIDNGTHPTAPASSNPIGADPGQPPVMTISKPTDPNEVLVGTPVEYAVWQEFGTSRSDAQPYLRPALELAKGNQLTILKKNGKFHFAEYLQ